MTLVPAADQAELTRLTCEANAVWARAKHADDWASFEPYVDRLVALMRRMAHERDPRRDAYDVWLDHFEQGTSRAFYDDFFARVKDTVVPLLMDIRSKGYQPSRDCVEGRFDAARQWQLARDVAELEGVNLDAWWLTETEHPFSEAMTTNYAVTAAHVYEGDVTRNLYTMLHEGGHNSYEQGVDPSFNYTSLSGGTSAGMHEGQSRFFENYVGRDRAFAPHLLELLKRHFPGQMMRVTPQQFWLATNRVEPQPIRTEADELTYPLHVIIRYEIEQLLFSGEPTCPASGRSATRATSASACPTTATVRCRTRTGRPATLATSPPTRSAAPTARSSRTRCWRTAWPGRTTSRAATSPRSASGCTSTSGATGAPRTPTSSSGWRATRASTPRTTRATWTRSTAASTGSSGSAAVLPAAGANPRPTRRSRRTSEEGGAPMRALLQRVEEARVEVGGQEVGSCGRGFLVLLGVSPDDTAEVADALWEKIYHLRVFGDEAGKTNLSLADISGEVLVVSQFTLFADCRKGRRPSFNGAAEPGLADELYRRFCDVAARDVHVEHGTFGAEMRVSLVNDGPFTIWLDTDELARPRHTHR